MNRQAGSITSPAPPPATAPPSAAGSAAPVSAGEGAGRGKILALLCFAQFMLVLDFAIVNVALPSIQRSLSFSPSTLQWVVGAYALFYGGFLLIGGRTGDVYGRKRMFVTGLAVFTVASLVGGVATTPFVLITARAVQGLAAAAVSPAVLAIIASKFTDPKGRAMAMGVFGAVASAGFTGGVLAGGVLTQWFGWRSILFVNIPVGIVLIALAARMLAADHNSARTQRINLPGAALITISMCVLSYALTLSNDHSWASTAVVAPLAASAVLLIAFIAMQARGESPLIPLSLFRNRSVAAANVIAFLSGGVMSVTTYFLSVYMQQTLHYNAITTGLAFFPQAFIVVLASKNVAEYTGRFGPKPLLIVGAILLTVGSVLLIPLPLHGHFASDILPGGLLLGLGVTTMMISTTVAGTAGVPGPQLGAAAGLFNSNRQLGVGLLLAIAVTLGHGSHMTLSSYHTAFVVTTVVSVLILLAALSLPGRKANA